MSPYPAGARRPSRPALAAELTGSGAAADGQDPWGDVGARPGGAPSDGTAGHGAAATGSGAEAAWPVVTGTGHGDGPQAGHSSPAEPGSALATSALSRPPWADATPDGREAAKPAVDPLRFIRPAPAGTLTAAFAKAAGVAAATETLNGARERRGRQLHRLAARAAGRAAARRPRLRAEAAGPRLHQTVQAQRSDIDNAIIGLRRGGRRLAARALVTDRARRGPVAERRSPGRPGRGGVAGPAPS